MSDASPIPPEELIRHLDETAFYIAGRGLPLLVRSHYFWMARFTTATLEQRPSTRVSVSVVPTVPGLRRLKVRFTAVPGGVRFSALLLAAVQVTDSSFQFISRLPYRLLWSVARGIQKFAVLNLNAVPPLVAAIVIVFLTGDAWRILGQGFDIPLTILVSLFLLIGLLAVGDVLHVRRNVVAGVEGPAALGGRPTRGRSSRRSITWVPLPNSDLTAST